MDWFLYDRDLRHKRVKTLSNICYGAFYKNSERLKAVNYFWNKTPTWMCYIFLNTSLQQLLKMLDI